MGGYHDRGQMENIIKELKGGIGMENLPSGDFGANSFWFSIGVMVYNTFILQKTFLLPEEYKTKTIQTLRWLIIETAGKVIRHSRRLWLLLATTLEKLRLYRDMRSSCMVFT
ncbi:MAG: transposase [Thermodesulfovibrionales bacterium]